MENRVEKRESPGDHDDQRGFLRDVTLSIYCKASPKALVVRWLHQPIEQQWCDEGDQGEYPDSHQDGTGHRDQEMHEDGPEFIEETHRRHVFENLAHAGMIGRGSAEQANCGFLS